MSARKGVWSVKHELNLRKGQAFTEYPNLIICSLPNLESLICEDLHDVESMHFYKIESHLKKKKIGFRAPFSRLEN